MADEVVRLIWLDLETSGLDSYRDATLEIAAIATDEALDEMSRFCRVLRFTDRGLLAPVVLAMHEPNGLLDACARSVVHESDAEMDLTDWVKRVSVNADKTMIAGSGVAHFDLHWMRDRGWGVVDEMSYQTFDIGVARRVLQMFGLAVPALAESSGDRKVHRAMADVEAHLQEARLIRDWLQRAGSVFTPTEIARVVIADPEVDESVVDAELVEEVAEGDE